MTLLNNLQATDIFCAYLAVLFFFLSSLLFGAGSFFAVRFYIKFNNPSWENLCTYLALGVGVHGLIALTIPLLGLNHIQFVALWTLFVGLFSGLLVGFSRVHSLANAGEKLWSFFKKERLSVIGYSSVVFLACTISCLSVTYPEHLPDGPYVFKEKVIHNKIQLMTANLPADNYIAFAFSDFFLRGISFREVRPLLPGQEVSNRPVLMGLVGAVYRKLFNRIQEVALPIGEYVYLGTKWPAVGKFGFDSDYLLFLFIGIALNSLVFLPIMLIGRDLSKEQIAFSSVLLMTFSPYFLSQIIFIWPKMMSGFFVIMALREALKNRASEALSKTGSAWLALLLGLAYHAHPIGLPYFIGFLLYLIILKFVTRKVVYFRIFLTSYFLVILPWLLWTKLQVGASSSLLGQNLLPLYPDQPALNFIWIRFVNLFATFFPTGFTIFPFNNQILFADGMLSIFGAIGIFVLPFGIPQILFLLKRYRWEISLLLGVPFLLFWGVFTNQVRFTIHGLQPVLALLGLLSFLELSKKKNGWAFVLVQLIYFIGTWALNFYDLRVFDFKKYPENGIIFCSVFGLFILLWQKMAVFQNSEFRAIENLRIRERP